ncbi:MAG: hypothetical protein AB7F31_04285 [Parachlamydiales bacterium]
MSAVSDNKILQEMPSLTHLLQWDNQPLSEERVGKATQLADEARSLYQSQTTRYKWAGRLGGDRDYSVVDMRFEIISGVSTLATLVLFLGGGVNILGRSIYYRSFDHIRNCWKRYLGLWLSPAVVGASAALAVGWGYYQLRDLPKDPHQETLDNFSEDSLRRSGTYALMDQKQFVLAYTVWGLRKHFLEEEGQKIRNGGSVEAIENNSNQNLIDLNTARDTAYWKGCSYIHCKNPNDISFSLQQMQPQYP